MNTFQQYLSLQDNLIQEQLKPTYRPSNFHDLSHQLRQLHEQLNPYQINKAWEIYHNDLLKANPKEWFAASIDELYDNKLWSTLYTKGGQDDYQAEFLISEFLPMDKLTLGSIFFWYIFPKHSILTSRKTVYTKEDIEAADQWVNKYMNWFKE